MTSISEDIAVNDTRLHVRIDGADEAPPVVLVHALATDHRMWDPQAAALSAEYRVLRYDLRGHGRSAVSTGPFTMDALAEDLLALLDHFAMRPAHVVGLSLGGLVAMATALRDPAALRSIAICDSRADMPPEFQAGIDERNRIVRDKGMDAVAGALIQRWFTAPTLAAKPDFISAIDAMIRGTPVAGFTSCAEAIKSAGLRARIREIRLPSLFIVGEQDAALPMAIAREMQSEIPGARLVEIVGAGHLSNLERPRAFNEALLNFLGAASRGVR
jgi:3-oxoadipate enol-lactonase